MIVHINKGRSGAFIVSIPRDSYVDVPAGGDWRGGKNKINAALAFGGANLAAKTVYNLTKVPLNGGDAREL
jgi:anionic cell wall polymer biosynthesis LytR-Cps2A-Psr (LCP) family protein